jgi:hypothetical protein
VTSPIRTAIVPIAHSVSRRGKWGEGWSLRHGQTGTPSPLSPQEAGRGILAGTGHLWGRRPRAADHGDAVGDPTRMELNAAVRTLQE